MNYATPFRAFRRLSDKYRVALMLTVVLSLICLTACQSRRQCQSQSLSHRRQSLTVSDTASMVRHTITLDTIHVIERETVWMPPDSVGRQYPRKTIHRESGDKRVMRHETVTQKRDTIYLSDESVKASSSETDNSTPTNQWVPLVIILAMIITAIIILAIRIFK